MEFLFGWVLFLLGRVIAFHVTTQEILGKNINKARRNQDLRKLPFFDMGYA